MKNITESDSDYEDLQAAIEASLEEAALEKQQRAIPPLCLMSIGTPVKEILKQHAENVVSAGDEPYQRINIRRTNLFDDTLAQCRKASFSFEKPFSVRFIGEAAVDTGGGQERAVPFVLRGDEDKGNTVISTFSGGGTT